ncbi:MAG: hypothetical protein ACJ71U_15640 [Terriglobales bacterium]
MKERKTMAKTHLVIGAGILIVVVGLIGVASGFSSKEAGVSMAQSLTTNPTIDAPPTNALIEGIKAELDQTTQYELTHGCLATGQNGHSEFCGASKERVGALQNQLTEEIHKQELAGRSTEAIAQVKKNIQTLAEREATVVFMGTSANPYTNIAKRIEHWQDDKGFLYLVNPENNQIVQFGPGPGSQIAFERDGGKSLNIKELQQTAEAYLSRHIADFDQVKTNFSFRQMSKPGNVSHAFRWEATTTPAGEDRPPFVQVVLSPAGEPMSFNDTRSLYSE